ncbi:hypothetical protein ACVME8_009943 [Bradyrhizobium diazoefficiens]
MGKKTGKTEPAKVDQVYVLGLDANGKPRGARFAELKDSIVSAAMDMKCRVLIDQPEAVSALGMKLPVGRVYGGGKVVKLFVPNIRRELHEKILEAAGPLAGEETAADKRNAPEQASGNTQAKSETDAATAEVRCISPVTSGFGEGAGSELLKGDGCAHNLIVRPNHVPRRLCLRTARN